MKEAFYDKAAHDAEGTRPSPSGRRRSTTRNSRASSARCARRTAAAPRPPMSNSVRGSPSSSYVMCQRSR
jgi:hypothetical protein